MLKIFKCSNVTIAEAVENVEHAAKVENVGGNLESLKMVKVFNM